MAQQTTAVLIDDQDPRITYLCFSYRELGVRSYYNGSWTTSAPGDNCAEGWFSCTFNGTGIRVAASVLAPSANFSIKLDDGDFVPQSGLASYISPTLPAGEHTLTYALPTTGLSTLPFLDYLAVTPGPETMVGGEVLAVDDTDPGVRFEGAWRDSLEEPLSFYDDSPLYGGSAHWSSSVGDSMTFQFEGSSVTIYGIAANISQGNISTSYTLTYPPSSGSPISAETYASPSLPPSTLDSTPFLQLFSTAPEAPLPPGTYTLVMNVTGIQPGQALGVDFVAYNPSFSTLGSAAGGGGGSGGGGKGSGRLDAGEKAGITLGVLAFAAIVAALLIFLRRRYARPRNPKFRLYDSFEPGDRKSSFPLQPGKQTFPL